MESQKHIVIEYEGNRYDIDVNPKDTLYVVILDLHTSILQSLRPISFIERMKIKMGYYVVKDNQHRIVNLYKPIENAYYKLEL